MRKQIAFLILLCVMLVACRSGQPAPTATPAADSGNPTAPPITPTPFEPQENTPTPTQTATPVPTATPVILDYGPDNFPDDVNPLTGLEVADPSLLDRRPLAVKVTNFPRWARPQWGLSMADIVYEYYQNGGIARFHALFLGNDVEQVGPIRSARFFDADLIRMYKSVFAFGSGDFRVLQRFNFSEFAPQLVNEFPAGCGPMCRIETTTLNHLVTNTETLSQYATDRGLANTRQDLTGMLFQNAPPAGGNAADSVFVRYGGEAASQVYGRWDYDRAANRYLRYQDVADDFGGGERYELLIDRLTDEPISAANVVVLLVPHEYFSRDPEIVELRLGGSGKAYAFRDGQVYEVVWNHPSLDKVLYLTDQNGELFPFKPGNTWFEIVGVSAIITQPDRNTWRFQFKIP